MDEPTAALTESDVERLFGIVRLLKERGVAVIYISHRLQEVFELADRVTVLRDGHFVGSKPVAEISEGELIRMMVGRTITELFPKLPSEMRGDVLEVREPHPAAARPRRSASRSAAGRSWAWPAWWDPAAARRRRSSSASCPPDSGEILHRRPEGRTSSRPARP